MNESAHLWLIPLFPFLGFLLNGILGSRLPRRLVSFIGVLAPLVSFAIVLNDFGASIISAAASCPSCGTVAALALPAAEALPFHWLAIGPLQIDFTFVLDQLSAVMLLVVTGLTREARIAASDFAQTICGGGNEARLNERLNASTGPTPSEARAGITKNAAAPQAMSSA